MPENPTSPITPDELRPVREKERLTSVDVLRGFALFVKVLRFLYLTASSLHAENDIWTDEDE